MLDVNKRIVTPMMIIDENRIRCIFNNSGFLINSFFCVPYQKTKIAPTKPMSVTVIVAIVGMKFDSIDNLIRITVHILYWVHLGKMVYHYKFSTTDSLKP
jgi:hypothetical protein